MKEQATQEKMTHQLAQKNELVPYIAYEAAIARADRMNLRLCIIIVMLLAIIGFLVWRDMQYEDVVTTTETVTQDTGDGNGNNTFTGDFIGGDYYGETNSNTNTN